MVQLAAEKPWTAAASPSAHRPRGRFGVLPPDMLEHAKLRDEFGALQHVSYASFSLFVIWFAFNEIHRKPEKTWPSARGPQRRLVS